ncbi:Alpha/beta hydrolase fold-1 [Leptodontidium sp. MPI-SDFR-AT-0119]|nr:Alpha/beta hydrolase fold-1 [Leptodontidium sp. MPI-SDFR-AT-0119]
MSKPTIVFCHGAWHTPSFFDKVIAILEPLGYKCVTFSFPGTGNVPPVKSLDEDIEAVRAVVLKEVDVGADVVVSAHSWGGVPTCSALDGLSKAEREREGKPGGVVKLAFVTSFILPEETSIADALGGPLDVWIPDADENLKFPDEVNKEVFYHDLPSDEADEWASKIRVQSLATFMTKTKSAAWKKIPTSYMICENDRPIPLALQESMIATVKEQGGEIETERLFVSHSPHLAMPEKVAGFLRRAAGEDWKGDL